MKVTRPLAVMVAALALAGCKDSGLPGMNLPLQVAEHKPTPYPLYTYPQGQQQVDAVEVGDRDWLLVTTEYTIPDALLVAVPAAGGTSYVLAWDEAPFDRVYHRVAPGRYHQRMQIPRVDVAAAADALEAAGGAEPAANAGHDAGH